ncbi:hemolymph lipopolysaccharide-binding protein-like [Diprion similis]|uniref:hemolymph lipopolysaccharide-binding protein-like n=1 Tax=Diprion similis TaxID=362088 RepID=UPI001EF937B3|nr:hemolymph lipopolysaccharide-binding protein-like [Diprion similis]
MCPANSTIGNSFFVKNTPTLEQRVPLPVGYNPYPDVGAAYKAYNTRKMTWNEARKYCMLDNANLAIIDSYRKHDIAVSLKAKNHAAHLGHHRLFDRGEWTNIKNGHPLRLLPWASDQPDPNPNCNCGSMWSNNQGLTAIPCDWKQYFICEIPLSA